MPRPCRRGWPAPWVSSPERLEAAAVRRPIRSRHRRSGRRTDATLARCREPPAVHPTTYRRPRPMPGWPAAQAWPGPACLRRATAPPGPPFQAARRGSPHHRPASSEALRHDGAAHGCRPRRGLGAVSSPVNPQRNPRVARCRPNQRLRRPPRRAATRLLLRASGQPAQQCRSRDRKGRIGRPGTASSAREWS